MPTEVDVRTTGWNNPDCCTRIEVDDSYEDDEGYWHHAVNWEDKLLCQITATSPKTDYCKRCNKVLRYP